MSIDDYVSQQNIDRIDFLKVDVQGAEMQVLLGAISSIKKCNPAIYIEWEPECHSSFSGFAAQFFDIGKTMGWKYGVIENNELREIDLALCPEGYQGNLIIPGAHSARFKNHIDS